MNLKLSTYLYLKRSSLIRCRHVQYQTWTSFRIPIWHLKNITLLPRSFSSFESTNRTYLRSSFIGWFNEYFKCLTNWCTLNWMFCKNLWITPNFLRGILLWVLYLIIMFHLLIICQLVIIFHLVFELHLLLDVYQEVKLW